MGFHIGFNIWFNIHCFSSGMVYMYRCRSSLSVAQLSSAFPNLSCFPNTADMLPLSSSSTSMTSLTMYCSYYQPTRSLEKIYTHTNRKVTYRARLPSLKHFKQTRTNKAKSSKAHKTTKPNKANPTEPNMSTNLTW